MSDTAANLQVAQAAVESEAFSVDQLRERFWSDLMPLLPELSDWDLSLLGLLVFWSGRQAPGVPVRKSWKTIAPRIRSRRAGGSQPADRHVLERSAKHLAEIGLIERTENNTLWRLIFPRPTATAPAWPGFYDFNARLWRRDFDGPMQIRAAIARLSFHLDADGGWSGSRRDLAAVVGVTSPLTAINRVQEIGASEKALLVDEQWREGRSAIVIKSKEVLKPPAVTGADVDVQLRELRSELWYPELVDQAIAKAKALSKSGRITSSRMVTGFYRPIVDLQKKFSNPPLIKYALEQTLRSDVFRGAKGKKTTGWHRYALRVAENNRFKFAKASDEDLEIVVDPQQDLRKRELAMRELLRRASQLNGKGETGEARELLREALGQVKDLAPLFDNDKKACERALRLSFKQGSSDFVGVEPDDYAFDFYPEWSPA